MLPRLREAKEKAAEILAQASNARAKSIQLKQIDFAGDLSAMLLQYAEWGEKHYFDLMKAASSGTDREIKNLLEIAKKKDLWYGEAEARSLKTQLAV